MYFLVLKKRTKKLKTHEKKEEKEKIFLFVSLKIKKNRRK